MSKEMDFNKSMQVIEEEFETQYLADELPEFDSWNNSFIEKAASRSAIRLRSKLDEEQVLRLTTLLKDAQQNKEHILIKKICELTWIDWLETAMGWSTLQKLLFQMEEHLQK